MTFGCGLDVLFPVVGLPHTSIVSDTIDNSYSVGAHAGVYSGV